MVGCGPAWVPAFFWGNSPSLVLVFAGRFLPFGCPGSWCFLGIFTWVLSSHFQCLLMAWGGYGCPWLSTLRSLAVEVVTLVLCQVLVGLPSWGCSASGFLGPAVFLVFTMGSPVPGRDCVLPQSAIVTLLSLLLVGLTIGLHAGSLPQADAVGFSMRWSGRLSLLLMGRSCSFALGSSSLDLVGVGGFHRVPSGCGHPLGSIVSFCHY